MNKKDRLKQAENGRKELLNYIENINTQKESKILSEFATFIQKS